jgi:hypothetical protein
MDFWYEKDEKEREQEMLPAGESRGGGNPGLRIQNLRQAQGRL